MRTRGAGIAKLAGSVLLSLVVVAGVGSVPTSSVAVVPSSETFRLHNYLAAGKCIGISTGGYAGSWWCTTNPDQTWHWGSKIDLGGYQLVNGNGQCLGVDGGSWSMGA